MLVVRFIVYDISVFARVTCVHNVKDQPVQETTLNWDEQASH